MGSNNDTKSNVVPIVSKDDGKRKFEINRGMLSYLLTIKSSDAKVSAVDCMQGIDNAFLELERVSELKIYSQNVLAQLTGSLLHLMIALLQDAVDGGASRKELREMLPNVWRIHGKSSFIKHLQDWPRGYAGDFDAVNSIVDGDEDQPQDTLAGILGRMALHSLVAQQHREKLTLQSEEVRKVCRSFDTPRILSIACGPSRDLEKVQKEIAESGAELWLVDFDSDALDESRKRLSSISSQIRTIHADVKNPEVLFSLLDQSSGFHLIYAGGLMDYLVDQFIQYFLTRLSPLVLEGGVLMFTNIKTGNPYRPWIEIMAKWFLKERDEDTMMALLNSAGLQRNTLELDPTGLTWIAKAFRE